MPTGQFEATNGTWALNAESTGPPPQMQIGPKAGVWGHSDDAPGVQGESATGNGLVGISGDRTKLQPQHGTKNGVVGSTDSNSDSGVWGNHPGSGYGVAGSSASGSGVIGLAGGATAPGSTKNGVVGRTSSGSDSGVWGDNTGSGYGVGGTSKSGTAIVGLAGGAQPPPLTQNGVMGRTTSATDSGVWGDNAGSGYGVGGSSTNGIGVYGFSTNGLAAKFDGNVEVTGDITLVNKDCAEDFEVSGSAEIEPGSVVVIDSSGTLRQSDHPYDKRVAGVVSGVGEMKPGIVLGRGGRRRNARPVALVGTVVCKVDAQYSPIEVGDLLTTSATPGYAMKVIDPSKAFGTVIGKALQSLEDGKGLLRILVALQ